MLDPALQREGLAAVTLAFTRDLGWLPRELPSSDFGIDMMVEVVRDGRPTGRQLAIQVKAGVSYFRERSADGIVFRDSSHFDYWTGHSLPVIVALYDPSSGVSYWQSVSASTVMVTGKGWKMLVPWTQLIDPGAEEPLSALAGGDPYVSRLSVLRADLRLIQAVADGHTVLIDAEEWVNKTSGRGTVRVTVETAAGRELVRDWAFIAPGWAFNELLPSLFPWADLEVEEDMYADRDRDRWDLETGAWDKEEGRYIVHSVDFEDWAAANLAAGLRPYADDGEVASWQLRAQLNTVGESFLELDGYLSEVDRTAQT